MEIHLKYCDRNHISQNVTFENVLLRLSWNMKQIMKLHHS